MANSCLDKSRLDDFLKTFAPSNGNASLEQHLRLLHLYTSDLNYISAYTSLYDIFNKDKPLWLHLIQSLRQGSNQKERKEIYFKTDSSINDKLTIKEFTNAERDYKSWIKDNKDLSDEEIRNLYISDLANYQYDFYRELTPINSLYDLGDPDELDELAELGVWKSSSQIAELLKKFSPTTDEINEDKREANNDRMTTWIYGVVVVGISLLLFQCMGNAMMDGSGSSPVEKNYMKKCISNGTTSSECKKQLEYIRRH